MNLVSLLLPHSYVLHAPTRVISLMQAVWRLENTSNKCDSQGRGAVSAASAPMQPLSAGGGGGVRGSGRGGVFMFIV